MSKFDKMVMSNEEETCVVFNYEKYRLFYKYKLEELAREELEDETVDFEEWGFLSYVEYGFYTNFDGEKFNGWHMRSFNEDLEPKRNSVAVIVLKVKEMN